MNLINMLAIVLILGGAAGLAYGQFSFTSETHDAKIGPLEFSVEEKETVNVPGWIAAAAIGGGILMLASSRRQA